MQGVHLRKYGVEATFDFEVYEVNGVNLRTDWVPAKADCEIMKNGGASTECDNTATDEGSTFSIVLTATEMQFARGVLKIVDAATKVFLDKVIVIETYGNASAQHAFDLDTAAIGGSPLVLGAGDVGDFKEYSAVHFFWNTIDRSGAAVAPSTAGTLRVYKDDGTGEVTAPTGITDTRAFDGVTGLQECKIDTSANSFYSKHKNYSVILVGAVIDTKTVNVKIGSFSIENRWANVHFQYGGK